MSSLDETSDEEAFCGPEGRERSVRSRFGHRSPRRTNLPLDQRLLRSSGDKGSLLGSEGFEFESWPEREDMEGRSVIWGCEGRPGTPVDDKGDILDYVSQMNVEGVKIGQHMSNREAWGVRRHRSAQSSGIEQLAICGSREAGGPGRRGARTQKSVEAKQVSPGPSHSRGAGRDRAWVSPRRGTPSRMMASEESQYPSSDTESSDELSEVQMMRVTISRKEKDQAKSSGPTERGDTTRQPSVCVRDSLVEIPASQTTTASRGLTSGTEKLASGEPEGFFYKKKQTVVLGKEISRPSYQGGATAATAAAPAAAGSLPKASPRKKPVQERKPVYEVSSVTLGRSFPSWGQRLRSAPVEPATFPPISGVALLGKSSRCPLSYSGPKQCKPCNTVKKSVGRRTKGSQPTARDDELSRDPGPQAQLPTQRLEQPRLYMYAGEFSSGDPSTRSSQTSGGTQFMALSQRGTRPKATASSGDQEPPVRPHLPVPERQQHPLAVPGCIGCMKLQKEIDNLKEQLAVKNLAERFQAL